MSEPAGRGLAVLTYHAFAPRRSVTATDPSWFAETLGALTAAGYHGLDLADWVARGRPDEPRGFALAFDDGLASVLEVAGLIEHHRIPATVFVVTDRVGRDNAWPGQPRGVPHEQLLDWRELSSLAARGFTFGAHGRTHTPLTGLDPARLADELPTSRDTIEQRLGMPCPLLAYPYGATSARVRGVAATTFAAAFGTTLGHADATQDPHDLSRIDAYYLDSERSLEALVHDRWRGYLRWRRRLRAVRRAVA
jgi:peptidoglycan/xylan/chitin deacetylase (PgdA/CDA1 family)